MIVSRRSLFSSVLALGATRCAPKPTPAPPPLGLVGSMGFASDVYSPQHPLPVGESVLRSGSVTIHNPTDHPVAGQFTFSLQANKNLRAGTSTDAILAVCLNGGGITDIVQDLQELNGSINTDPTNGVHLNHTSTQVRVTGGIDGLFPITLGPGESWDLDAEINMRCWGEWGESIAFWVAMVSWQLNPVAEPTVVVG